MLSLLLNKNPWLSLGVVRSRVLWSLVSVNKVMRRADRWEDKLLDRQMDGWVETVTQALRLDLPSQHVQTDSVQCVGMVE